jgi:ubiquinone/menaquinone biosynthesis C-methylase UbiE
MERVPEPELMDAPAQAEAYALADFEDVNRAFVERFLERFPGFSRGRVLDLGCGPADICVRLARALPAVRVVALDGAEAMLEEARHRLRAESLQSRVELVQATLPRGLPEGPFDAVLSNSLLHHLHDPMVLWEAIARAARPGAPILVVDLFRPASPAAARAIVEAHAANERLILREDFYNSLLAAFTPEEVRAQLDRAGLGHLSVRVVSERHLAVVGRALGA